MLAEDEREGSEGLDDAASLEAAEGHLPEIRSVPMLIECRATHQWCRAIELPQIQPFQRMQLGL